jgi:hypothetical protein
MAILRENALIAPALEKKLPRLLMRDYKHPNFSACHLLKDVELFLKEASSYELTASSLEGIRPVLEWSIALGFGDSDYSAISEIGNPIPQTRHHPHKLVAGSRVRKAREGSHSFSIFVVNDENISILTVVTTAVEH